MQIRKWLALLFAAAVVAACSTNGSGSAGAFRLIEFLESGKDNIPRNRTLTFRFSGSVASAQDLFERLKVQNVQTGDDPNFARAVGSYVVDAERVTFIPDLPNAEDRSDAGFKANGNYVVFLKGGPDGLTSSGGDRIATPQELLFDTNEFFEDPVPTDPPRALGLLVRDVTTNGTTDLARLDPRPSEQGLLDNSELISNGYVIDPGAGGPPSYGTAWEFELLISEPIDPATVTPDNIEMFEIFADATTSGDTAPPAAPVDHFGTPVDHKVPINVEVHQGLTAAGVVEVRIRVIPAITLVDNTRYRLTFGGNILGLDFRQAFIGENGLTGDGETLIPGSGTVFPEPGGLGYVTEFLVQDRPAINSQRTVTYDPLADGILPEYGQSALTEDRWNSALYNPVSSPSTAVGFLSGFGNGQDGDLSVQGTVIVDTGDTPNDFLGNPFTVTDLNPTDIYNPTNLGGIGPVTYDSYEPSELNLASLTVSNSGNLRVIGVNPILFRVRGIVQIDGTLDITGEDGEDSGGPLALGGAPGAGGGAGGNARRGTTCSTSGKNSLCVNFEAGPCSNLVTGPPFSNNGLGPGRGMAGGDTWSYGYNELRGGLTGTGGGGASHAASGTPGEDVGNVNGTPGTPGPKCASGSSTGGGNSWTRASSVIGIRGQPGPLYGDREVAYVLWGGSGGGAGGASHIVSGSTPIGGAAGGGGAGSVGIFASGPIFVQTGLIDARGGGGGKGEIKQGRQGSTSYIGWDQASGSGGGGSGGSIVLISGDQINMTAGILDARGGIGGERPDVGTSKTCNACNAGGVGGKGFIFLMDKDGEIAGLLPGLPGEYDGYANGVLTISAFQADRFSSIAAVTELFNVGAADPAYLSLSPGDVLVNLSANQAIRVFASSSKGDPDEPLQADPLTEIGAIEVALATYVAGSVVVEIRGDLGALNPTGAPDRDAFCRIDARFEYDDPVEAALGPFASIDQVDISYTFNG
ncbi:MAG: hypothetical protein ACYTED_02295 [Planctomycetota bacterium]|jgi:hypothetical protein